MQNRNQSSIEDLGVLQNCIWLYQPGEGCGIFLGEKSEWLEKATPALVKQTGRTRMGRDPDDGSCQVIWLGWTVEVVDYRYDSKHAVARCHSSQLIIYGSLCNYYRETFIFISYVLYWNKQEIVTEKMTQCIELFVIQHEDLNMDHHCSSKTQTWWISPVTPVLGNRVRLTSQLSQNIE